MRNSKGVNVIGTELCEGVISKKKKKRKENENKASCSLEKGPIYEYVF